MRQGETSEVPGAVATAIDDPVNAHGVDQVTQSSLAVRETVVIELVEVGAWRLLDVDPGFAPHLPATVHAPDAEAGVTAPVGEDDLEVGAGVHHSAEDERRKGDGAIGEVSDAVGQVVPVAARSNDRVADLMNEDGNSLKLQQLSTAA